jgi:hypothetical protein
MTARNTWKSFERRVANALGGTRNPLSGTNSKHTAGDVIHNKYYVEVKLRSELCAFLKKEFLETLEETEANAKQENKEWLLVFKKKGSAKEYVLMDFKRFVEVLK